MVIKYFYEFNEDGDGGEHFNVTVDDEEFVDLYSPVEDKEILGVIETLMGLVKMAYAAGKAGEELEFIEETKGL